MLIDYYFSQKELDKEINKPDYHMRQVRVFGKFRLFTCTRPAGAPPPIEYDDYKFLIKGEEGRNIKIDGRWPGRGKR